MDIDLLSKMVKDLILERDKVALPGVGTFVCEMVPATFSDKGFVINPPYRRLSFRQKLDNEDTALVDLYASSNGVSQEEADGIVRGFLQGMKDVLIKNKVIIFPGLGRLRATKENAFFFVPDEDLDIYPEGFGLEPVSLKSSGGDVPEAPAEPEPEPESESEPAVEPEAEEETPAEPAPEEEDAPKAAKKKSGWFGTLLLVVLIIAVLLLVALAVLGRVAPELVDKLLYSAEELQILNS